jgi:ornithine cyclodeaminase/alanine dehydrogenase
MKECIGAVESAFRELATGTAIMPTRLSITLPVSDGWLGVMPTFLLNAKSLTTKIVTVYSHNTSQHGLPNVLALIVLNDIETGRVEAVMDGSHITAMRTGAVGGVATKYLASKDAVNLGIFGCGVQARTQLEAVREVRDIESVMVYDSDRSRMQEFVSRFLSTMNIRTAKTSEEVVRNSDIIVTATTSKTPVFNGTDLKPGTHINAIGAFTPDARELDDQTISKAKIVIDSSEAAFEEAGDLIIPMRNKVIRREDIWAELGEVVSGSKPGRTSNEELTIFKSVGLGIQDAAVGRLVFEKARREHVGTEATIMD